MTVLRRASMVVRFIVPLLFAAAACAPATPAATSVPPSTGGAPTSAPAPKPSVAAAPSAAAPAPSALASPAVQPAAASPVAAGRKLTIGFIPENIQDPGFRSIQRAMIQEGNRYGDTIKPGDAENSVEKQVTVIENVVASGVDCLAIRARNQNTLAPATDAAHSKNIPVVGLFDTFPGADVVIGFDQTELGTGSGKLGGQYLKENFDGKGDVIILNADSLGGTTIDRAKGIVAGLKEIAPDARVVANAEAFTVEKALEVTSSALQANPNVRLVVGINDSAAQGALAALKNAGKNVPKDAGVVAIAGEGVAETLNLIKTGEIYGTTSAALLEIGQASVPACHKLVNREPVEKLTLITPLKSITKSNVDAQIAYVQELDKIAVQ